MALIEKMQHNFPSLNIFIPVTTLEVIDIGNGGDTVTCSAQNVVDMQWSVSYSGIRRDVDLDMILDSVNQELAVTGGITMSSALISQSPNSIRSVMRTAPVSSGRQRVQVEFVCFGRTGFGGTFEEVASISTLILPDTIMLDTPTTTLDTPTTMASETADPLDRTSELATFVCTLHTHLLAIIYMLHNLHHFPLMCMNLEDKVLFEAHLH